MRGMGEDEGPSAQVLRTITENMLDLVLQVRADGTILYASPSHNRLLGRRLDQSVGMSIFDNIHPDDLDRLLDAYREDVETTEPRRIAFRCQHADGHYLWLESQSSPLLDADGKLLGAVICARDVTRRRELEEQREELLARLLRAKEEIKTLRGIIPICASCKKIRDDRGFWQRVETYISENTEAVLTQGLCPECFERTEKDR
jgi:PAS domain S-box-containing protein